MANRIERSVEEVMREVQCIATAFQAIHAAGDPAALATVVNVQGSTYRRPGARMLIKADGQTVGAISGGCLENDVCLRAQGVMASGEAIRVTYDAVTNEETRWGLGLGCTGVVDVLIEPLKSPNDDHPLALIAACLAQKQAGVLVTVFNAEGTDAPQLGDWLLLYPDHSVKHRLRDDRWLAWAIADAQISLRDRQSRVKSYPLPTGRIDVLIEWIPPITPLLIFGAGQDATPLAQFAKALGWRVTLVDRRPTYATAERFPMVDEIILANPEDGLNHLPLDAHTVAVIMTHNYWDDREILKALLPSPIPYLGILGPKHRTEHLLQDLIEDGIVYTSEQLSHLYAPVGLDIGADTPDEIGLSIVAEIQAVLANRSGGLLRERKGPIHPRSDDLKQPSPQFEQAATLP